ncbi:hypothetical protein [Kitasatospora sp. NBC_01300]|uniref:hypothetical protein n=1 Tax=Kitasatospora sp. NBC_01300 TaxID=2903574 RepID=UPI00352CB03F|nr:hypothetical protein OG556_00230 [Kitasatospora sp. NBC_01300]WSK08385.1 hypothetical protein OG556_33490 [Kitasatospora sp. NBC_01300]
MTSTDVNHPDTVRAFRTIRRLVSAYLGLSVVTLAAAYALRDHPDLVNPAVWIRGALVVASAVVTYLFTTRAARGSHAAYRRLRIISAVMIAAIVVIICVPGTFPFWMKAEQALCGLVLAGVAAVINGRHLRTLFARSDAT